MKSSVTKLSTEETKQAELKRSMKSSWRAQEHLPAAAVSYYNQADQVIKSIKWTCCIQQWQRLYKMHTNKCCTLVQKPHNQPQDREFGLLKENVKLKNVLYNLSAEDDSELHSMWYHFMSSEFHPHHHSHTLISVGPWYLMEKGPACTLTCASCRIIQLELLRSPSEILKAFRRITSRRDLRNTVWPSNARTCQASASRSCSTNPRNKANHLEGTGSRSFWKSE